jgi:hypothetical protein
VPDTQLGSSLQSACQWGVRIAPGLMMIRLIDMPDRMGKLSAVTRLIEPRSFSSTISPLVSEVACLDVMAEASAEIHVVASETRRTGRQPRPRSSMDASSGIRARRDS